MIIFMKRKNIIPIKVVSDMVKEKSSFRVSEDASKFISNYLENLTEKIIKKADLLVLNKNKKTIQEEDIKLSYKQIKNN